jgi:hypothetical protein
MNDLLRHLTDSVLVAMVLGGAVLAIVRPGIIVQWARQAHKDIPEGDKTILWIARFVGICGLGVGIFFFIIIIRSFRF